MISPLAPDWEVITSREAGVISRGLSSSWPVSIHQVLRPSADELAPAGQRREMGRAHPGEDDAVVVFAQNGGELTSTGRAGELSQRVGLAGDVSVQMGWAAPESVPIDSRVLDAAGMVSELRRPRGCARGAPRRRWAPIMATGRLGLPRVMLGMIDASAM